MYTRVCVRACVCVCVCVCVYSEGRGRHLMTHLCVNSVTWIFPGTPLLSVLLATLTVFPKRQKRGILRPTMPATTSPELIPTLIWLEEGEDNC